MEHADGNGAVHTERGHTSWRETLPVLTKVVHVTTSQGLTECWPYVKERLNILYFPKTMSGSHRSNALHSIIRVDHGLGYGNRKATHWMPLPEPPEN